MGPQMGCLVLLLQVGLVEGQWWWQRLWGSHETTSSPVTTAVTAVHSRATRDYLASGVPLKEGRDSSGVSPRPNPSSPGAPSISPSLHGISLTSLPIPKKTPVELALEFKMAKKIRLWKERKAGNRPCKMAEPPTPTIAVFVW